MKSIERKFNNEQKKNPNLSSLICYVRAVKGMTDRTKEQWFHLVDWDDYKGSNRTQLLTWIKTV